MRLRIRLITTSEKFAGSTARMSSSVRAARSNVSDEDPTTACAVGLTVSTPPPRISPALANPVQTAGMNSFVKPVAHFV